VLGCQYRVPYFLSTDCEHLLRGLLVIDPERRMSVEQIAKHSWSQKCKGVDSETTALVDQLAAAEEYDPSLERAPLTVDPAIVDYICSRVGVTPETVEEKVRANACDDLSAMYHLLARQAADVEREAARAHTGEGGAPAVVLSASPGPPLSPSSLSPFFHRETAIANAPRPPTPQRGASSGSPAGSGPPSPRIGPTEIYHDDMAFAGSLLAVEQQQRQQLEIEKLLTLRRHTMGPGQTPMYLDPWDQGVLPQTDLTTNLPKVSNLPPESFSVKDPHLLKPPPALLGVFSSQHGRRASDGGGAYLGGDCAEAPAACGSSGPDTAPVSADCSSHSSGDDGRPTSPAAAAPLDLTSDSPVPYSVQVEHFLKSQQASQAAAAKRPTAPESPRKRRTGLDTVLEPPEISPDLQREAENRMGGGGLRLLPPPQGGRSPSVSPSTSPVGTSLRQRRSGLSTVHEKGANIVIGGGGEFKNSLHLPTDRYSPVRRLSDPPGGSGGSQNAPHHHRSHQSSLPVSCDPSPSDVRALQEEYSRLHMEAVGAAKIGGTSLPNTCSAESANHLLPSLSFLRPPSPTSTASSLSLPRRLSDSGVGASAEVTRSSSTGNHRLRPSTSSHSAKSEPMQQLYDDMYSTEPVNTPLASAGPCSSPGLSASSQANSSRRFSYPNSPVHVHIARQAAQQQHQQHNLLQQQQVFQQQKQPHSGSSLTQYLQELSLQPAQEDGGGPSRSRFKGSITQGVPGGRKSAPASAASRRVGGDLARGHSLKAHTNLAAAVAGPIVAPSACGPFGSGYAFSADECAPPPGAPAWSRHHSVCAEDLLTTLPASSEILPKPEICVTDVSGGEVNVNPFGGQRRQHPYFGQQQQSQPQQPMDEST